MARVMSLSDLLTVMKDPFEKHFDCHVSIYDSKGLSVMRVATIGFNYEDRTLFTIDIRSDDTYDFLIDGKAGNAIFVYSDDLYPMSIALGNASAMRR